ncbi:MAG: phosphoenolpyruvate carboxylase [Candidatus Thorarchaeota archaeon]
MTEELFRSILHILGNSLGIIIKEQAGEEIFSKVEYIRKSSKTLRDKYNAPNFDELYHDLDNYINNLTFAEKKEITRSFSLYLLINNIAELVYRNLTNLKTDQTNYLEVVTAIKSKISSKNELVQYLKNFKYRIVLTQHPTEVRRRTILIKEKSIYKLLVDYFGNEKNDIDIKNQLLELIEGLWLTAEVRLSKPTVKDEIEAGGAFANYSLFTVIPEILEQFYDQLTNVYDINESNEIFFPSIDVGSWIGGDRDGNPNVKVGETEYALNYNHDLVIKHYLTELSDLFSFMSISRRRIKQLEPNFSKELEKYLNEIKDLPLRIYQQNDEPFRQWIAVCQYKLEKALSTEQEVNKIDGYQNVDEFRDMLNTLSSALHYIKAENFATGQIRRLIHKIDIFGFYFAKLDIRQHSKVFEELIAEIYRITGITQGYESLNAERKIELLIKSINSPRIAVFSEELSNNSQELWNLFEFLQKWSLQNGVHALGSIIISMTEDQTDILEVLVLEWWVGLYDPNKKRFPMPIVPLFETIIALKSSINVMEYLWTNQEYMNFLNQLEYKQEVMIGYSDSAKDGGFISSQWNIYQTIENIQNKAMELNKELKLFFFHGRGGSVGRGGGPPITAIKGLPNNANRFGMKITEQGEVISQKYLHPDIAYEMLTQTFLGILDSNFEKEKDQFNLDQQNRNLFSEIVNIAEGNYRNLVHNNINFVKFFEEASPIEFINYLNIGSRPAKRKKGTAGIEDLRAIPWIFAWTQNRLLLPVWYGLGKSLEEILEKETNLTQIRIWIDKWSFFKAVIDNLSTQLLKADMNSAKKYSTLSVKNSLFEQMFDEYFETRRNIRRITEQEHITTENPFLQKAIEVRTPYLDPLTIIQIHAIEDYRKHENTNDLEIILLTISGIIAGMKNTG